VAGGACSFAVDCDDGNPCTDDLCDIGTGGGAGAGICVNNPVANGQPGDCPDGIFCNGAETCTGGNVGQCLGVCTGGPNNGLACFLNATETGCPNGVCLSRVCVGGPTPGVACDYHEDCGTPGTCAAGGDPCPGAPTCSEDLGGCQPACANNAACSDGDACNGTEICVNPGVNGFCQSVDPVCGLGADCVEKYCAIPCGLGCQFDPCESDADCNNIATACRGPDTVPSAPPLCFFGRCCNIQTCTRENLANCSAGGRDWYASDTGRVTLQNDCPPCPAYESGIGDDPFTAVVGPATLSPANNVMSGTPIRKIGDDYNFCDKGEFLTMSNMRFVGGVDNISNSRTSFEFYTTDGTLVEDIFYITNTNNALVQNVVFQPTIVIPCQGFVVAHVLQSFAQTITARGEFFWVATDLANGLDKGTNVPGTLYVETDLNWGPGSPPQPVANFIKVCLGDLDAGTPCSVNADCGSNNCQSRATDVLAFELVGTIKSEPAGACCKSTGGAPDCNEEPIWDCEAEGGTFTGVGTKCAACSVTSPNAGGACRNCVGGDFPGAACTSKDDCPNGGTCALAHINCRECLNNQAPCDDDGDCPSSTCGPGACELNTACNTGACCEVADGDCVLGHTPASCAAVVGGGVFQGFGTDCVPNCCPQPEVDYTGSDNCADVTPNVLVIPCASNNDCAGGRGDCNVLTGECYLTVTGNNSGASSTPMRCLGGTNANADCL